MAPYEAARLLRYIAWALAYAHARGVVHRDIKPENILIDRESRRPLVADFGIAQVSRIPGSTLAGEIVGTPEFMSPEQCAGDNIDGRSDLYSLGIIGYYVLTGAVPFSGPDIRSILTRHIATEPRPLRELRPRPPAPPRRRPSAAAWPRSARPASTTPRRSRRRSKNRWTRRAWSRCRYAPISAAFVDPSGRCSCWRASPARRRSASARW